MSGLEPAVLDASVLDELEASVGGDRAFVDDLARTFLEDAAGHVTAIEQARSDGDAGAIVRPAHTLKSSSATLGCLALAAVARTIELGGQEGRIASEAGDGTLTEAWEAASAAVTARLSGGTP